jgi:membrane associated rhomboid family serine protease
VVFTFAISGLSVPGHLGGLIVGALVATVLAYAPAKRRTMIQAVGCGAIAVVLLVLAILRTTSLLA